MSKRTIIFGVFFTIFVPLIAYLTSIELATYLIGIICIVKGLIVAFIPEKADEIDKFINTDRWNAFQKKSKEFKKHVKKSSIGYIVIGLVIVYLGYRFKKMGIEGNLFPYYLAYGVFVAIYFFGETLSVIKSNDIDQYRRFNIYVAIALMIIAILIL